MPMCGRDSVPGKAQGLYVIVNGSVRAFSESLDGREQVIHVERAGGTVAEVPVFDDGNYPSTVAASSFLFAERTLVSDSEPTSPPDYAHRVQATIYSCG